MADEARSDGVPSKNPVYHIAHDFSKGLHRKQIRRQNQVNIKMPLIRRESGASGETFTFHIYVTSQRMPEKCSLRSLAMQSSQTCHTPACENCYSNAMYTTYHDNNSQVMEVSAMFNPEDYIELRDDGFALCTNPMADGGLESITVNTRLMGESLRSFESSIKRMVLSKLFSPKFGEVILAATRMAK
jgi:hypothetical protein